MKAILNIKKKSYIFFSKSLNYLIEGKSQVNKIRLWKGKILKFKFKQVKILCIDKKLKNIQSF